MYTYLSQFFSGTLDPTWPHVVLIGVTLLGGIIVAIGIILEAEKFWSLPTLLVIVGVALEATFTILLFGFDEGISGAQQSKIISLETRIAPRVLGNEQYTAIRNLRGKVHAVSVLSSPDVEPALFAAQLGEALYEADIVVNPVPASAGERFVGTQICLPEGTSKEESPLWKVLSAKAFSDLIELGPAPCSFGDVAGRVPSDMPKDIPLIVVGERKPFFPNGTNSLRFRIFPGFRPHP